MRCARRLSVAAICGSLIALGSAGSARADICPPPNDAPGQACVATFSTLHAGELAFPTDLVDWYRFDWNEPSAMTATLRSRSPTLCVNAEVFDTNLNSLGGFGNCANALASQAASTVDFQLPPGSTYVAVTLVNADPLVEYDLQMARTGGVPAVPTNLYVEPLNASTIRAVWSPNSRDHTGFDVEGNGVIRPTGADASSFDWGGLAPGTKVCFRVRATNSLGPSGWYPPTSPSDLCATSKAADETGGSAAGVRPESTAPPPPAAPRPPNPTIVPGAPQFVATPLPGAPAGTPPSQPPTGTAPSTSPTNCRAPRRAVNRAAQRLRRDQARLTRAQSRGARAQRLRRLRATVRRDRQALARAQRRLPAGC
jgi:hypothetical protein